VASAIILYYHRVASLARDPQLLAVSPGNFADQLAVLKETATVLPLEELVDAAAGGDENDTFAAITFDDGYADNLQTAAPILKALAMPTTVFASWAPIRNERMFWWDELEQILLAGHLRKTLTVDFSGRTTSFDLGEWADKPGHFDEWTVLDTHAPTPRHAAYLDLFRAMMPLALQEKQTVIAQLRTQLTADLPQSRDHMPMTRQALVEADRDDLMTIGCHTMNHPILSQLPAEDMRAEIVDAKRELESLLGSPRTLFSYPYGRYVDFNQQVVDCVKDSGFRFACTTAPGLVTASTDPLRLPRFGIRNLDGDAFRKRLEECFNWRVER
jgi:peptidoglycan/xylan/chitin deacetylase (PgdA/CDA1 family)